MDVENAGKTGCTDLAELAQRYGAGGAVAFLFDGSGETISLSCGTQGVMVEAAKRLMDYLVALMKGRDIGQDTIQ